MINCTTKRSTGSCHAWRDSFLVGVLAAGGRASAVAAPVSLIIISQTHIGGKYEKKYYFIFVCSFCL